LVRIQFLPPPLIPSLKAVLSFIFKWFYQLPPWTTLDGTFARIAIINLIALVMPVRSEGGAFFDGTAALNKYADP
jgi:hypothetical protein